MDFGENRTKTPRSGDSGAGRGGDGIGDVKDFSENLVRFSSKSSFFHIFLSGGFKKRLEFFQPREISRIIPVAEAVRFFYNGPGESPPMGFSALIATILRPLPGPPANLQDPFATKS